MITTIRPANKVQQRLRPLKLATFLQSLLFWVPVEKLFMSDIGFTPATIGVMAATYAAVVPVLEVPSGILADRWSRRGVLIIANTALALSALIGGLALDVSTYILSALVLGVFFAMNSGTVDSIVYDTLLEETGTGAGFEREIGRFRLADSAALVIGALAGGVLAGLASPRITYLLTVPVVAASVLVLLRCPEPRLHRADESMSLRAHTALTFRTLTRTQRLLPIITMSVLTGVIVQIVLEFGPLWLVALAAPAVLYGPHWAGLTAGFGLAGVLADRVRLDRPATATTVAATMTAASLTLTLSANLTTVIAAQVILALLVVTASIHLSKLLHDAVPSTIRAGVTSGVSTFTWITFLPFALGFGLLAEHHTVHTAGWMITTLTATAGALLIASAHTQAHPASATADNTDHGTPCQPLEPATTAP